MRTEAFVIRSLSALIPFALGADSVRSAVSDAITDEFSMGCRYAVFDHATQASGEPITVQGFDAPRRS